MNLTDIRTAVTTDRITTETITEARLDRMIANAVRQYSRYNPVITKVTLSSIAEQEFMTFRRIMYLWYLIVSGGLGET